MREGACPWGVAGVWALISWSAGVHGKVDNGLCKDLAE